MNSGRPGATLVELVVALALSAIVSAAAATALVSAERHQRRVTATSDDRRSLREAALVLATELQSAAADSIRLRGDTAVDVLSLVGSSVLCAATGSAVVVPPSAATQGDPFTVWRSDPQPGDLAAAFDSAVQAWSFAVIDSVVTRATVAGCTPATGFITSADSGARLPATRLRLDRALSTGVTPGAPLRVVRPTRYLLHRGGDGSWALAQRRCDRWGACGAAQPAAGPLAAAADSGLALHLVPGAFRLDFAMRAPGAAQASAESLRVAVGLRNRANAP